MTAKPNSFLIGPLAPIIADKNYLAASPPHHDKWRPEGRMRFLWTALVDEFKHGLAHGFCATHFLLFANLCIAPVMSFTVAYESTRLH
jgi:hypothetical protein